MSKKDSKPDFSYDSNLVFAQKLYRKLPYKWLRTLIMVVTNILIWALMIVLILYLAVPVYAILMYNPPLVIFVFSSVCIIALLAFFIRAVSKRNLFLKEIKKRFSPPEVSVKYVTRPHSTLFFPSRKIDVIIETPFTVYEIMFFPTLNKNNSLLIFPDGVTAYRVHPIFMGRIGSLCGLKPRWKKVNVSFKSENSSNTDKPKRQILLLNPVPKELYLMNKQSKRPVLIGPGERFPGFSVENVSSLIRLIDRDTEREL